MGQIHRRAQDVIALEQLLLWILLDVDDMEAQHN